MYDVVNEFFRGVGQGERHAAVDLLCFLLANKSY